MTSVEEMSVTTVGERNGFFRHSSGFWLPTRIPHEGGSITNGLKKIVRDLLACAEAVACLQAEIINTLKVIKHHQSL